MKSGSKESKKERKPFERQGGQREMDGCTYHVLIVERTSLDLVAFGTTW